MNGWIKRLLLVLVCLVLGLSACSAKDGEKGGKKGKTITIMLDWYPNAVHTAIYDAIEKGYFEKEGLNVEVKMPAEANDPLKLVAADKIDLAFSYQPQVIVSRSQNIPVVSIGAVVRHPLDYVMARKESGIKRPRDLEDKKIGYSSSPIGEAMVKTMVQKDGGDPTKVKMTDVGFDLIPAMATGRVDAIDGGYINHEKILLEKQGHPLTTIDPVKYGVPDYYELVAVASEKGLSKNRTLFQKFWKALSKGQADAKKDPEKSLKILLDHEDKSFKLDSDVEKQSLNILLPLMDAGKRPFGYQEEDSWKRVSEWLYKNGITKEKIDADKAFENMQK